jgi:hypothetical protein
VLPDDHPLVKALAAQKEEIKTLKGKAQKLDALEEASKTEAQKAADRLAAVEAKALEAERRALRFEIASEFKLSSDDAKLLEHVPSEDGMRAIAAGLAAQGAERKKNGNHVPREGATPPTPPDDPMRALVAGLFHGDPT